MSRPTFSRYSPQLLDPEVRERLFVAREPLLAQLVADVIDTINDRAARYDLLIGPRGAGKSHLLTMLGYRLRQQTSLQNTAIIIELAEEEYVTSLLDLLARILRSMPQQDDLPTVEQQIAVLQDNPGEDAIDRAANFLYHRLKGRGLVLLLENLDVIMNALGRGGQGRLRALLQEVGTWSIIGSSRTLSEAFSQRGAPFYHTFSPHKLLPLSAVACRDMLFKLSITHQNQELADFLSTPTGLARVEAIHHLTGGNPRAMALLFPHLTREKLDELVEAFYDLAEELTPYFQEQMARLPPGQRAILELLAERWKPQSVSEIARAIFTTPQTASGQLRYLYRDQLVMASELGRQRFYEVANPLFRIAWAMKHPNKLVITLVRFLRAMYGEAGAWREGRYNSAKNQLLDNIEAAMRELSIEYLSISDADSECSSLYRDLINKNKIAEAVDIASKWHQHTPSFQSLIYFTASLILDPQASYNEKINKLKQTISEHPISATMLIGSEHYSELHSINSDLDLMSFARQALLSIHVSDPIWVIAAQQILLDVEFPQPEKSRFLLLVREQMKNQKHTRNLFLGEEFLEKLVTRKQYDTVIQLAESVELGDLKNDQVGYLLMSVSSLFGIEKATETINLYLSTIQDDLNRTIVKAEMYSWMGSTDIAFSIITDATKIWTNNEELNKKQWNFANVLIEEKLRSNDIVGATKIALHMENDLGRFTQNLMRIIADNDDKSILPVAHIPIPGIWWHPWFMLIARKFREYPDSTTAILLKAFPETPHTDLLTQFNRYTSYLAIGQIINGREDWFTKFLNIIDEIVHQQGITDMARAILCLPDDVEPYMRLPAPSRQAMRLYILLYLEYEHSLPLAKHIHARVQAILDALPPEPEEAT